MSTVRKPRMKTFWEMTGAEKKQASKEFDQEFIIDSFRELTPQERAQWEQIQRDLKTTGPHPLYKTVRLRLPRNLVRELDALARQKKISRTKLILLGLGVFLSQQREKQNGPR